MNGDDAKREIREWETKILMGVMGLLITAFGVWAGIVWNGTREVVATINHMRDEAAEVRLEQERYRTTMERRLTITEREVQVLEQRQTWVIETLRRRSGESIP